MQTPALGIIVETGHVVNYADMLLPKDNTDNSPLCEESALLH